MLRSFNTSLVVIYILLLARSLPLYLLYQDSTTFVNYIAHLHLQPLYQHKVLHFSPTRFTILDIPAFEDLGVRLYISWIHDLFPIMWRVSPKGPLWIGLHSIWAVRCICRARVDDETEDIEKRRKEQI